MRKYLLDTCTISELIKSAPDANVLSWLNAQTSADLYLSTITIAEIRKGIEMTRAAQPVWAEKLEAFLASLVSHYESRILALDIKAAEAWGKLLALTSGSAFEDGQIAAIAIANGMIVVTRNLKDFAPLGVPTLNPY